MCLGTPGRIVDLDGPRAQVDVGGARRLVDLTLIADQAPRLGDWVLIHVGFALARLEEAEAEQTLALLHEATVGSAEV